jgi:hypothetical protein
VILAPGSDSRNFRLCLDSLLRQTLSQIEILVVVDDASSDVRAQVAEFHDARIRVIATERGTISDRFNSGAQVAQGEFVKFIGPECPMLYPYALAIETAILKQRATHPFISAGSMAFTVGGLALSVREALAIDAGSDGALLRVDSSCVLLRRSALADGCFDETLGPWALVGLLFRLAGLSGAVLGPYGLSTAWRREPCVPEGDLPMSIKRKAVSACASDREERESPDWPMLVELGKELTLGLTHSCQWEDPSWVLADIHRNGLSCPL